MRSGGVVVRDLVSLSKTPLLRMIWPLVLLLGAFVFSTSTAFAEPTPNWDLGPIEIEDQLPIALLHSGLPTTSPRVAPEGTTSFRTYLAWSNTHNAREASYEIDAETRVFALNVSHAFSDSVELGAELPLVVKWGMKQTAKLMTKTVYYI